MTLHRVPFLDPVQGENYYMIVQVNGRKTYPMNSTSLYFLSRTEDKRVEISGSGESVSLT